jgi:hypothetical protein
MIHFCLSALLLDAPLPEQVINLNENCSVSVDIFGIVIVVIIWGSPFLFLG